MPKPTGMSQADRPARARRRPPQTGCISVRAQLWMSGVAVLVTAALVAVIVAGVPAPAFGTAPVPIPTPGPVPVSPSAPAPASPGPSAVPGGPGETGCGLLDISCRVEAGVDGAVRAGLLGLVDLAVAAYAWTLSQVAELVFTETSVTIDDAFYGVYNDIASIVAVFVVLMFAVSLGINAVRPQGAGPVRMMAGLLRAILGISFAGGIAFLLVRLWDDATLALIDANQARDWDPSLWVTGVAALAGQPSTALVALGISLFSGFGLLLVAVILFFRGILVLAGGLLGIAAMAGQATELTQSWGRRWFWTMHALAASKFWIVAFWIYGSRAPYESDSLINALRGLLMILLMVAAPWILLRLTTIVDGYIADIDPIGLLGAAGAGAGAGAAADLLQTRLASAGGGDAAALLDGGADAIPSVAGDPAAVGRAGAAFDHAGDGTAAGDPATVTGGTATGADANGTPNGDEAAGIGQDATRLESAASGQPASDGGDGQQSVPPPVAGPGAGPGTAPGAPGAGGPAGVSGGSGAPEPGAAGGAPAAGADERTGTVPQPAMPAPGTGAGDGGEPAQDGGTAPAAGVGRGGGGAAGAGAAGDLPVIPV